MPVSTTPTVPVERSKPNGLGYKAGSGTKLTPKLQDALIKHLKNGNYISTACAAVGISPNTYQGWKRKGRPQEIYDDDGNLVDAIYPDTIYGRFVQAINQAEAEAEIHAVESLKDAFSDDWRAAEAFLSRKFPQRWNPKVQMEVTGKDGGAIEVQQKRQALFEQLDTIHIANLGPEAIGPGVQDAEIVSDEPEQLSLLGELDERNR